VGLYSLSVPRCPHRRHRGGGSACDRCNVAGGRWQRGTD